MMGRAVLVILGLLVALSAIPCNYEASAATVFDAAADMTEAAVDAGANPNGPWSYGYRTTASATDITLMTDHGQYPDYLPASEGYKGWFHPCVVAKNMTDSTITFGFMNNVVIPPGVLIMHPDYNESNSQPYCAVVRWTAPISGPCSIEGVFGAADNVGTTTDVHIVHNGVSVFDDTVWGWGDNAPFSTCLSVAAGDVIDFVVGDGGNFVISDATSLAATIAIPEPSTFILLGVGSLGILGYALRRRRRAA